MGGTASAPCSRSAAAAGTVLVVGLPVAALIMLASGLHRGMMRKERHEGLQ